MKKQEELGAIIIVKIAKNNRPEVNALLLRNGVSLPNEASDLQVAQVVTELLKKSKTFKNEFMQLMANSQVLNDMANEYSNFTDDVKDFSQYMNTLTPTFNGAIKPLYAGNLTTNSSLTTPSALSSSATDTSTSTDKKSTWETVLGIGAFGVNSLLQLSRDKTDQKLAEASIAQANSVGLEGYGNINPNDGEGMGTGTIVFLTILGLVVVGGGTWWYIKTHQTGK